MINPKQVIMYEGRPYRVDQIIHRFRKNWTVNGNPSDYQPVPNHIKDLKEIIKYSVDKAYLPSMRRAIKIHQDNETREAYKKIEERKNLAKDKCEHILNDELADFFGSYIFSKTLEEFLIFEERVCEHIRRVFVEEYDISGYTWGNAQKWLTIAIKYVLSSSNLPGYFDDLFMVVSSPIDSIVINRAHKMFNVKKPSSSWSNIDDFDEIKNFEISLRDKAVVNGFVSPLIWEILTWSAN